MELTTPGNNPLNSDDLTHFLNEKFINFRILDCACFLLPDFNLCLRTACSLPHDATNDIEVNTLGGDKVFNFISNVSGNNVRIYGRKCEIRKVYVPEAREFMEKHHFLGYCKSKYRIGLYFENELVALSLWGQNRFFNHLKSAELIRYCNKSNTTVTGGLSKLIKHFISQHSPNDVYTVVLQMQPNKNAFEKIGFISEGFSTRHKGKFYVNACKMRFVTFVKANEMRNITKN